MSVEDDALGARQGESGGERTRGEVDGAAAEEMSRSVLETMQGKTEKGTYDPFSDASKTSNFVAKDLRPTRPR